MRRAHVSRKRASRLSCRPRTIARSWDYDEEIYKRRNEVERLFRKLKGFRRIFTRFEKLDIMFRAFLYLALAYLIL
jgi:transposase